MHPARKGISLTFGISVVATFNFTTAQATVGAWTVTPAVIASAGSVNSCVSNGVPAGNNITLNSIADVSEALTVTSSCATRVVATANLTVVGTRAVEFTCKLDGFLRNDDSGGNCSVGAFVRVGGVTVLSCTPAPSNHIGVSNRPIAEAGSRGLCLRPGVYAVEVRLTTTASMTSGIGGDQSISDFSTGGNDLEVTIADRGVCVYGRFFPNPAFTPQIKSFGNAGGANPAAPVQFNQPITDTTKSIAAGEIRFDYDTYDHGNGGGGVKGGAYLAGGFFMNPNVKVKDGFELHWVQTVTATTTGANQWNLPAAGAGRFPDAAPGTRVYPFESIAVTANPAPTVAFQDLPCRDYAAGHTWRAELGLCCISKTPNLNIGGQMFREVRVIRTFTWGWDFTNPLPAGNGTAAITASAPANAAAGGAPTAAFINTLNDFYDGMGGGPPAVPSMLFRFSACSNCFEKCTPITPGGNAQPITIPQDSITGPIPLGFPFPFSGGNYNDIHLSDHGICYLSNGGVPAPPAPTPLVYTPQAGSLVANGPVICPFWSDTIPAGAASQFLVENLPGTCIISWLDVQSFGIPTPLMSFQLVLHQNGEMEFHYGGNLTNNSTFGGVSDNGVIGCSPGQPATLPGPQDLSLSPISNNDTTFEEFVSPNTMDMAGDSLFWMPLNPGWDVTHAPGNTRCASSLLFGDGCDGMQLDDDTPPVLGTSWVLTTTGIHPVSALSFTFLALGRQIPPIPLELLGFEAPGCLDHLPLTTILTNLASVVSGGTSSISIDLPASTAFSGLPLSAQTVGLTTNNAAGFALSNGILGTLGF